MSLTKAIGCATVLAVCMAAAHPALAQQAKAVLIGGETDLDACSGVGMVVGLDPKGDNFLSVRNGPSSKNREIARLKEGDRVYLCDEAGSWHGVVIGNGDCGVTSPIAQREPYEGRCKSGWVFSRYIELIAG